MTLAVADSNDLDALRRSNTRLSALLDLSRALASELDLDRLLNLIMSRTTEVLDADRSTLFLVDYAADQLWSRVAQGAGLSEIRIPRGAGIAGFVATSGETVNIPDAYADPRFNQDVDRRTGYHTNTILCMPVKDQTGHTVGVLQVLNKRTGAFGPDDEALLHAVGNQAALALANASLLESRRKETEKSALLLDVMRSLSTELELDQLLGRIMATTTEVMHADRSSLFLVDHKTNELWFKVAQGLELREIRLPVGMGIAGHVAATGETVNIPDAYADSRFNQAMDRQTGYRTKTILCMPMRDADGTIVGVLQVLNKQGGLFTTEDEELLRAVGSQAVIALQNANLFDEVVRTKNYIESILHSMATGVVALTPEGLVQTANPAAERIFRFADGMPRGVPFVDIIQPDVNPDVWDLISAALQNGAQRQAQKLRFHASDGDTVTMNLSAMPLLSAKGVQTGVVLVIEDISREQQLMGTLSRVVSRQVAEQLMASGGMPSVGGQRKTVTVLMSDIRNFTTMSEMVDPEDIVSMLNDYFGRMIDVIFRYEGTLDKFIGDAIMAVFGTPMTHNDDPVRAVKAAVDMRRALREFNQDRLAAGKMTIEIGIGICTGEGVSGAIGSEERMEFTVIGDTVNVAARLEGLTKGYPQHKIIFSESVYEALNGAVPSDFLAEDYVKGKTQPVRIYGVAESTVYGESAPAS
jgi:adenylate cyclase